MAVNSIFFLLTGRTISYYSQSVSLVEATLFGVTKEVRQAKEEEQRNAALVEMQLRDEHSFPALGVSSSNVVMSSSAHRK